MIKLDGAATFQFTLGNISDFIDIQNLRSFKLYFAAGGIRPIIEVTFKLTDPRLIGYLSAGNILTVAFGINEPTSKFMQFELYNDNSNKGFQVGYDVTIKGAFYLPKFTSNTGYELFSNCTSLDVMQKTVSKYKFTNLITNIVNTNDKQDWCREGITPWKFIENVWKHSYINSKTFTSFAFDTDYIYFYDMKKLIQDGNKWLLSMNSDIQQKGNVISIAGYTTKNNHGYLSQLVGKNLMLKTFNIDTGVFQTACGGRTTDATGTPLGQGGGGYL